MDKSALHAAAVHSFAGTDRDVHAVLLSTLKVSAYVALLLINCVLGVCVNDVDPTVVFTMFPYEFMFKLIVGGAPVNVETPKLD
ncbi:MAG: hypothetical protein EBZ69_05310 [Alphaproteobacteria bacterium]|nr:hypothetical protein [Alphaproteobacteria bacterium]